MTCDFMRNESTIRISSWCCRESKFNMESVFPHKLPKKFNSILHLSPIYFLIEHIGEGPLQQINGSVEQKKTSCGHCTYEDADICTFNEFWNSEVCISNLLEVLHFDNTPENKHAFMNDRAATKNEDKETYMAEYTDDASVSDKSDDCDDDSFDDEDLNDEEIDAADDDNNADDDNDADDDDNLGTVSDGYDMENENEDASCELSDADEDEDAVL